MSNVGLAAHLNNVSVERDFRGSAFSPSNIQDTPVVTLQRLFWMTSARNKPVNVMEHVNLGVHLVFYVRGIEPRRTVCVGSVLV